MSRRPGRGPAPGDDNVGGTGGEGKREPAGDPHSTITPVVVDAKEGRSGRAGGEEEARWHDDETTTKGEGR